MADFWSVEFSVKAVFHWRICSYELTFFLFEQQKLGLLAFQQIKMLLESFFKCKLYLKKSVKFIRKYFLGRIGEDFFHHPYFRKQEFFSWLRIYLFFFSILSVQKQPPEVFLKISQISQENTCIEVSF